MEEKKKFTLDDVPGGYAMCTRNDCEVCNHCLRHLAFQKVGKGLWKIDHVNPLRVEPSAKCEYYRSDEPATYAKGFKKMQQSMLPSQYQEFSSTSGTKFVLILSVSTSRPYSSAPVGVLEYFRRRTRVRPYPYYATSTS